MHDHHGGCSQRGGARPHVLVVREQHNLRARRHVGQDAERRGATIVVELHEDVVDDERHRLPRGARRFDGGEAQREEELIPTSLTHSVRRHARPVGSHSDKDGTVILHIGFESLEAVESHLTEERAGAEEERRLVLAAVVVDPSREQRRGHAQAGIPDDIVS